MKRRARRLRVWLQCDPDDGDFTETLAWMGNAMSRMRLCALGPGL